MFDKFTTERTREDAEKPITESSLKDYGTAIERFISVFGGLEVERITPANAEQFLDFLRRLPSRPPNDVQKLTIPEPLDQQAAEIFEVHRCIEQLQRIAILA